MKNLIAFAFLSIPAALLADEPNVPKGAVEYKRDGLTQSIATTNNRPSIIAVKVEDLPDKDWLQSGGMRGIEGVTSRKFRTLPKDAKVSTALERIQVLNSLGYFQGELGIVREYPDGTRFDDVLYFKGKIFEHRMREKVDGEWKNKILVAEKELRPPGYTGLKRSCSDCHDRTGSGSYDKGLVPGGDGVFSDPLDWSLAK